MRIVFMGTPAFAVRSLEACLELGTVVAVVTQPDKPRGRGQEVSFSPVKTLAVEKGLTVLQPPKVRGTDFAEQLRALAPDVAVVTAYGKILPKDVLEAPRRGSVNVHASLLPRFRGAAPIQWAIAEGDAETGVCLMQMDEGMDTGPVIDRASLPIEPTDTSATLHDKLALLGGEVLRRSLGGWVDGTLTAVPQQGAPVMAPMIDKEFGLIDFTTPATRIERRLRAFTPWPGAFFKTAQGVVKVHGASVGQGQGAPGTVLRADPTGIELACGEGSLVVLQLQPEGKRVMTVKDFLPGRKLTAGDVWPVA
jgi:methionyl-tRNA formyltransferase